MLRKLVVGIGMSAVLLPSVAWAGGGGGGGGVQAVSVPWLVLMWARPIAVLLAAVLVVRGCRRDGSGWSVLAGLFIVALPWEILSGPKLDAVFQYATAYLATPLVRGTGLDVSLEMRAGFPTLVSETVHVHVNALCAGFRVFLHASTLGVVVAALLLRRSTYRWLFMACVPLFALGANVLRIAVSAHAAQSWAWDAEAWTLAHDVIGYGTFCGLFGALGLTAWGLARRAPRLSVEAPMQSQPAQ